MAEDDNQPDKPLEGDIDNPKKGGKKKPTYSNSGGRRQTDEERDAEEKGSRVFFALVAAGGFDWQYKDWEPTEQQRDAVKVLSFCGYTQEQIAYATGMSVESLVRYFDFELQTARMLIIGDLTSRAITRARQGDNILTMFLLKTRSEGRFSEKAAMVAQLADESATEGIDEGKRARLVGQILELLDARKNKPKGKKEDGE
jgi:hypothetical protein